MNRCQSPLLSFVEPVFAAGGNGSALSESLENLSDFKWILSKNGLTLSEFRTDVFDDIYGKEIKTLKSPFAPDIRRELVQEEFPSYAESQADVIALDVELSSDPSDSDYVTIPFSGDLKKRIHESFRRSLGRILLTDSIASRALFVLQSDLELAQMHEMQKQVLESLKTKIQDFHDQNPWYALALADFVSEIDSAADSFISEQERLIEKQRN
jgi:hypothetical protein